MNGEKSPGFVEVALQSLDDIVCGSPRGRLIRQFSTKLVRQDERLPKIKCCICLAMDIKGINCSNPDDPHFICGECFSMFVSSLCTNEPGKLLKSDGNIVCPGPNCATDPWIPRDVRRVLNEATLDQYIGILLSFVKKLQSVEHDVPMSGVGSLLSSASIADALNFKCPNQQCLVPLDPSPDGCSAMQCAMCNRYFCWLCFAIKQDSAAAHAHVKICGENPRPGELFHAAEIIESVHKRGKIEALRRLMMTSAGDQWQQSDNCRAALDSPFVSGILKESKISGEEVFSGTELRPQREREEEAQVAEGRGVADIVADAMELVFSPVYGTFWLLNWVHCQRSMLDFSSLSCSYIGCSFQDWVGLRVLLLVIIPSALTYFALKGLGIPQDFNPKNVASPAYNSFFRAVWLHGLLHKISPFNGAKELSLGLYAGSVVRFIVLSYLVARSSKMDANLKLKSYLLIFFLLFLDAAEFLHKGLGIDILNTQQPRCECLASLSVYKSFHTHVDVAEVCPSDDLASYYHDGPYAFVYTAACWWQLAVQFATSQRSYLVLMDPVMWGLWVAKMVWTCVYPMLAPR